MSKGLPIKFPSASSDEINKYNPAISLFGNRFYNGQTVLEYLNEFLGLIYSDKKIGDYNFKAPFINHKELIVFKDNKLAYNLPIKLNLKLFSFLSSSRIDSRHKSHEKQYSNLIKKLEESISTDSDIIDYLIIQIESLFKSYIGAGFNRDWCAKNFFPLSKTLITRETVWNASKANDRNMSWMDSILNFNTYYSWSKRNFMARGGELLYLQLCNAFLHNESDIYDFMNEYNIETDENTIERLYESLQNGFIELQSRYIAPFDKLVNYIELIDEETNRIINENVSWQSCEWCPQESWQEGYLFALELNRLLRATLDPIDKLEMLMTSCVLQVLRSLSAQSRRYADPLSNGGNGGALRYSWIFTHPHASDRQQRLASQRNLLAVQGLIQKALRHESLMENAISGPKGVEKYYKEADSKYGHKLFLSLGKKLGIIAPLKGRGARFVLTDKVIRYFVITLLPPGKPCSYEDFLEKIYSHFGIAVESKQLSDAILWTGLPGGSTTQTYSSSWLADMLRAGGFLTELSDACSIVNNPFAEKE